MVFDFFKAFPKKDTIIRILDNNPIEPMYVTIEEAKRMSSIVNSSCPFCKAGIPLKGKNDDTNY